MLISLISADNHFAIMAALFAIATLAILAERTRIGAQLTSANIAILAAIIAANVNIIPHAAPAYDFVFEYFVPMLLPLFLFKADLRRLFFETTRMTMAFLLACIGTIIGTIVAMLLLDLSSLGTGAAIDASLREPAIAGLFTSTYIGGAVNYAALGEITRLREDASFFSAATATDNLFSALYLAMLAVLPSWSWLVRRYLPRNHDLATHNSELGHPTPLTLAMSLTLALLTVATGDALTAWLNTPDWRYAMITLLAVIIATLFPKQMARLHGDFELGILLSLIFFAAIAAGANVLAMIQIAPLLILVVVILLTVHALITFGFGKLLGFSLPELITASNATVLGATTAPALAAAKGWRDLITPGVLIGVFGYALGTFAGTAMYQFWSWVTS
ncbi:DUF819 family protein [Nitrosomonas sp. Nm33]|uniref:DUF819 family protein n=1 Tax=Nitrosomonas sp. Nm33 TaxID=133724 RepID=UPI00089A4995|nr:DUF819 family protein [Nitrosomonas sp. Nm33]SDY83669.1 Uncharacterized membrane protein [Nitrosomonas sp. Nm33]